MRSPVTHILLALIAAGFVLQTLVGGSTRIDVLVTLGANVSELVWAGQWWRLLASIFLHIGLVHLLVNGWALYQLGGLVEVWFGAARLTTIFFGAGLAGSLASVLFTRGVSAGASGAIFGLLGALIGFLVRHRDRLRPGARSLLGQLAFWAGINIFLGFTVQGIDNAAHLGGLAFGAVMGLLIRLPRPSA